ncbi:class I SAM-dependent methyltransferase [Antarctobacter heliothermus]|uniref:16S rRNA m(2)G 1207 methyltransferase n=1 Tax=Antarctobacter heliothermus TaxID=74033 RepID=A0A239BZ83_9RHOB|nr:class I SAM-dependent methyltransferase [Antarctobacter heliothermus]SNS13307.1 16S rRNA m(2)G 1207 methyltransferase [Antarctobacter heliothermus]
MSADRLSYALATGGLVLPDSGTIALFGAPGDALLDALDPSRVEVIQGFFPDHAAWQRRGVTTRTDVVGPYAAVVVTLPRARNLAELRIAQASALTPDGLVIVDGAKTDGIESIAKALRARLPLLGQVSKAHGKCLWFQGGVDLSDWHHAPARLPSGDLTAPGVFSADGPDPASQALAAALPDTLKGRFADLGAGWGWLSRAALTRPGLTELHLVEADKTALDCARENVTDPRAAFHWADATDWTPPAALDGVIMNPPFHQGRKADPQIGRAFVTAAARMLAPHGRLWLVANRHLPYETALGETFRETSEIGGDTRFKILHAAKPTRQRR